MWNKNGRNKDIVNIPSQTGQLKLFCNSMETKYEKNGIYYSKLVFIFSQSLIDPHVDLILFTFFL